MLFVLLNTGVLIVLSMKEEADNNTVIVVDFKTHRHQWTDNPGRKSVKQQGLNGFARQVGLI